MVETLKWIRVIIFFFSLSNYRRIIISGNSKVVSLKRS
jgi:hypothetical protein